MKWIRAEAKLVQPGSVRARIDPGKGWDNGDSRDLFKKQFKSLDSSPCILKNKLPLVGVPMNRGFMICTSLM